MSKQEKIKISVLMSVYYKEAPENLDRAIRSIYCDQIEKPEEIVIVKDGPLTSQLEAVLLQWKKTIGDSLVIIGLKENKGLAQALNEGLKVCRYDYVARMDSDDISYPYRFLIQRAVMKERKVDVCGSVVEEGELRIRSVPRTHHEILEYMKKRCPFNHPSVLFKKKIVQKVGGYPDVNYLEDYALWIRLGQLKDVCFYNIQEPMVRMSFDRGQILRRRGYRYFKNEVLLFSVMLKQGDIGYGRFFVNVLVRFFIRMMPGSITALMYEVDRRWAG